MQKLPAMLVLTIALLFGLTACGEAQTKNTSAEQSVQETNPGVNPIALDSLPKIDSITDLRDGERYAIVTIGEQTWLAENLRHEVPGSKIHPDNPAKTYGRMYDVVAAQTACLEGWHLPSDGEWDRLEMAHGMTSSYVGQGGWRGEHGTHMKSTTAWDDDGHGTNLLGFNVLPAGYYFSDKMGFEPGFEGLGYSAAFWSAVEDGVARARFLFSPKVWVNKWDDVNGDSGSVLSCRCVKD